MNPLFKIIRFAIITALVLPIWVFGCVLIFLYSILLCHLFPKSFKTEQEDDNNIDRIIFNFKLNLISIFLIY
jgi:ABC-type dipeptide/oligopeptide/nickel transport system permease component